jgi:hypothetical protein
MLPWIPYSWSNIPCIRYPTRRPRVDQMTSQSLNYTTPRVDPQWALSRETHGAVAMAIHAIASASRSAEAIWEAPSAAEDEAVVMAVEQYLAAGIFPRQDDGRYQWGLETVFIPHFVTCLSDAGPGWSLHAPGSTDEEIASGEAPALASGPEAAPTADGYRRAKEVHDAHR